MRVLVLSLLLAVLTLRSEAADDPARPEVLVSIKPVYSIVAAVMQGSGRINVLLGGASSPHTYVPRSSDAVEIADADVIFWIGPTLEKSLVVPLADRAPPARVVAFADAQGVRLLSARNGGLWESNTNTDRSGGVDGHIWLDPDNAVAIARAAARVLGEADPKHARLYAGNADAFAARTMFFDARLTEKLKPVRGRPYIVFHDRSYGLQYFEAHYGLTPAGVVAADSEHPLDTHHLAELRALMKSSGAACILSTREISPQLVSALTEGTQVRTAVVEAFGANIPRGPILYQTLLSRITATLVSCLGG